MKSLRVTLKYFIFLFVFPFCSNIYAQENRPCERLTDTLSGIVFHKNTAVKATPVIGQEQLAMDLRPLLTIQNEDYDAEGIFDKTLVAGFIVTSQGDILGQRILKSSTINRLDSLYLSALKKFKWNPGKCEDKNVNSWMKFEVMIYKHK
ncbi:energy transducer TonB [Gaetbulibacter aestuarii]|uniref:TonB C-terminal domain-containing protein n=1 Tax=Gaetbulibacter aestuarii TaxID=1502358 RepID=A0ABW7MVW3_9FLAO